MLKFFLITIFTCAVACTASAQNIDSLKKILPVLNDSARVDCLNALSYSYIYVSKKDSALYYESLAYEEAKKINYIHGIAEAISQQAGMAEHFENNFFKEEKLSRESLNWYNKTSNKKNISITYDHLSFACFAKSYYDEANYWAKKAYEYDKSIGDEYNATGEIGGFASNYIEQGDYNKGFDFALQYLERAIKFKNQTQINGALITIGQLYLRIEDYSSALDYYRQSLENITKDDSLYQARNEEDVWLQMEFAEIYWHLHQYDSALYRYNLFDSAHANEKDVRVFLVSKGEYYLSQRQYDNALKNFLEGLYYHRKLNDRNEIMRVLPDIAKTYFAKGNITAALQNGRQGLDMALETNAKQFIRDGYQIIYSVYDKLHQTDSAYFYYQKFITIKDVVVSDQMKGKFTAYNYEQKITLLNEDKQINQQQLKIKQQQLKRESLLRDILIAGILLVVLLGFIIFRTFSLKRKNEKLESEKKQSELQHKATELEMQALRSQMNPHFIFNCLSSINRFILKNKTEEASDYLTKFSRLIRMVLNNSKQSFISLEDELETLRLYLEMERLRFKNSFDYSFNYKNSIDVSNIFIPPLLLQPFAENAIWHGLMHKQERGFLSFDFSADEKFLICTITDNGIGRKQAELLKSKSAEKQKSLGTQITASRLALLNKDIEQTILDIEDLVDAEGMAAGTRVTLKFRHKKTAEELKDFKTC